jgi:hypothetical protein
MSAEQEQGFGCGKTVQAQASLETVELQEQPLELLGVYLL